MKYLGLFLSKDYFLRFVVSWKTAEALFAALGAIWLVVRMLSEIKVVDEYLASQATAFLILYGVMSTSYALYRRRPRLRIDDKIGTTDVRVKVVVGDIMKMQGPCVVGASSTFDTSIENGLISPKSLQGQITNKYYASPQELDIAIDGFLASCVPTEKLPSEGRKGKTNRYKIGQVVRIRPSNRPIYLLAIAHMNAAGSAESTLVMVSDALSGLWQSLGEGGLYEQELLIPVLGTGAAKVRESRIDVIQEIIRSFIAASDERRVCDELSVVIRPDDFYEHVGHMEDLQDFLRAQCRHCRMRKTPGASVGEPGA